MRGQGNVEAERRQQRRRPRAGGDHDGRGRDASVGRLDSGDAGAVGHHAQRLDASLDAGAAPARGLGEGERGRRRIGEAGVRLPRRGADVADVRAGQEVADLGRRHRPRVDAELLLARDVAVQGGPVLAAHELHEADGLEAAVAADDLAEIAKDLQALDARRDSASLV